MFSVRHLLCMLPVITQAHITIDIQASQPTNSSVRATGLFETILNDEHKELFHITDRLLKNAIFNLTGQNSEIYLQEPNFGNDIYGNYKLEPVKTLLKPNRTKINVNTEEVFLNKIQAFNNDEYKKTQNIALIGYVEDNVTCFWKQKDVFPVEISYNIDVIGLGKDPNWRIQSSFGRNFEKTQNVATSASFTVNLGPKRDAAAILSATKVTLVIEIYYTATLTGHVLTKFENFYLWGYENYDIETVMVSAAMPHIVMLSEEITVEFYTNCLIKVFGEDLDRTVSMDSMNQCAFTMIDVGKNETTTLSRAQHKITTENDLSEVKKSPQGNRAVRNTAIRLIFVICMFLKIQVF